MSTRKNGAEPNPNHEAAVGYRRPPKQHTIKPGETRNPWGRRGKPRPKVDFLDEQVSLTINGRPTPMSRGQALDHALFQEAMRGSVSAAKLLESRAKRRRGEEDQQADERELTADEEAALNRFLDRELDKRQNAAAKRRRKR